MLSRTNLRGALFAGVAMAAVISTAAAAQTGPVNFDIASGNLGDALGAYAKQSGVELFYQSRTVQGRNTQGLHGAYVPRDGLDQLLKGTGLVLAMDQSGAMMVREASDPQSGSAAGDGADAGMVQALIVTAQKKEEQIQDVPIAISAFTEKTLEEQKIEGGFDLLKAIPNVTFSKNNFTSYNFSIRGIGTKAVSATTDPGVAVSFNNIALLQNRLFEQEYFDVERVEVLRGPQGTLYGRNATAGVINVISAKPNLQEFDGWVKGEVGNYHTKRLSAMVNIPLVTDKLGIRIAGALTDRQGYDYNSVTKNHVNGRDLWSGRITLAFNPTENIRTNLIWERFNEDDNRSRTGKQLCHRDNGPTAINGVPLNTDPNNNFREKMLPALFSQGCQPGSLYDDAAFGTPNGLALPFVFGMLLLGGDCGPSCSVPYPLGHDANGHPQTLVQVKDPYGGMMQSRDLRTVASFRDPIYRAKADVVELNLQLDITPALSFYSQTAYDKDSTYSFQDYNRFNTVPIFTDTSALFNENGGPSYWADMARGGVFCDPQLGCSNTMAGFDISSAKSSQFTQEIRLQSNYDGPLNFSAGANFTRFDVLVDYYVMYNIITGLAEMRLFNGGNTNPGPDITKCAYGGFLQQIIGPLDINDPRAVCPYIDPNPVESINGEGHNYFRSKNPYHLKSGAAFGELYWKPSDSLKVTAGLRYTDDRKTFIPVPSQVLLGTGYRLGGAVTRGYPELPAIKQHWGEWTGRLGVDWKPDLSFTNNTMLYAFYSRGYKGGGANPPLPGFATAQQTIDQALHDFPNLDPTFLINSGAVPVLFLTGKEYSSTFKPEFVNAFEVGAKNTLMGGALLFNAGAFFYDYKDYQVSQIRNRTAVNENFNAQVWGLEFETRFTPSRDFQLIANLGYLDSKIADGETSIDPMNRTQGNTDFVVAKPWVQLPSNCVVPVWVVNQWQHDWGDGPAGTVNYQGLCGGLGAGNGNPLFDPLTQATYTPTYYNGQNGTADINGGSGIAAQLGGNELPNSPHWTMNLGAQYGHDVLDGSWRAYVRGDAYWQSQSWARVYNAVNDKLHGWYNVNLSVWLEKPDADLKIEFYAKNLLDKTPITDAFINSDDTALTTNVFVLDPRLIGLSIKKGF